MDNESKRIPLPDPWRTDDPRLYAVQDIVVSIRDLYKPAEVYENPVGFVETAINGRREVLAKVFTCQIC